MLSNQENMKFRSLLLLLFATLGSTFALAQDKPPARKSTDSAAPQPRLAEFRAQIAPVLRKTCTRCHGYGKQEGKFRVDILDPDLLHGKDVDWWLEVFSVLSNREMPPEDAKVKLADADRRKIIEWLSAEIQTASDVRRRQQGHSSFRRMTRYEYNYTLQDLLGLPYDFAKDLPPEAISEDGFQNSSEVLHMTVVQFEMYRRLARKALLRATPALTMPVIILGGILGGVFTPTEASAVAVVYGILVGVVYYRTLTIRVLYETFCEAAVLSGAVMFVTATAHVMGYAFTFEQLADGLLGPIARMDMSPVTFLVVLSVVLIIAGTFLDGIAMIFIVVPLFFPAVQLLGIDPVHFGMVVVLCWGIGQQTPPVGAALFITSVIARVNIFSLTLANLPFVAVMLVVLGLVILFPELIVLWVPRALGL